MSDKHLYRFGDFELYADENVLQRNGTGISLTPKMYDMLTVLLRNPGQIVDKETLLKEVWPDSFVEEGNITFNIRQLRKALDDNAQSPVFIETVPRRGYRFIAPVDEIDLSRPAAESVEGPAVRISEPVEAALPARRHSRFYAAAAAFLLLMAVGVSGWYLFTKQDPSTFKLLSEPFASEKLSTTGLVFSAAISPDGQSVLYSSRQGTDQSLWLRHLPSAVNTEIIPPLDGGYYEIAISADGNTAYFTRGTDQAKGQIDIFRMPARGGIPEKIVSDTEGWLSVSPDGRKISFVRCPHLPDEHCSLWLADAAGGNERKLVSRPGPIRIGDNEISPDGKTVAFAAGHSRNQGNEFSLMEVGIDGGPERQVTPERFFNVKSLAWLPDRSALLLTASRIPNKYFRIWQVSTGTGAAVPLTKDSETYSVLSLDAAAERLVTTQIKQDFRAYRFDLDDPSKKQALADATFASFASASKICFSSTMSGNDEIWTMNADGAEQRQLTNDPADDRGPIVSADGKSIFFSSNRTGEVHVWKMGMDGSGQARVTQKVGGSPIFASTDGSLLYYKDAISGSLWSVMLETGEESLVAEKKSPDYVFKADGSAAAFVDGSDDRPSLAILDPRDRQVLQTFDLPGKRSRFIGAAWQPDGRSLLYILTDPVDSRNKLFRQDVNGSPPRLVADLGSDEINQISGHAVAPDAKTFVIVQGGWKHDAVLIKGLK